MGERLPEGLVTDPRNTGMEKTSRRQKKNGGVFEGGQARAQKGQWRHRRNGICPLWLFNLSLVNPICHVIKVYQQYFCRQNCLNNKIFFQVLLPWWRFFQFSEFQTTCFATEKVNLLSLLGPKLISLHSFLRHNMFSSTFSDFLKKLGTHYCKSRTPFDFLHCLKKIEMEKKSKLPYWIRKYSQPLPCSYGSFSFLWHRIFGIWLASNWMKLRTLTTSTSTSTSTSSSSSSPCSRVLLDKPTASQQVKRCS